MPQKSLTDRFVASVHATSRANYFDTKSRGLALRVTPNGVKTWCFVYRAGGKPQWLTLGAYPAVTLADARGLALAKRHARDVERRDPAAERRAEKKAAKLPPSPLPAVYTFADLAKLYETFAQGQKKTWKDDIAKIRKYLTPVWGSLPLRSITRAHVHERLDTLVARGMTIGVNRIQALISRLFTLALDRSLIDAHPAARMMKRFQEHPCDRVLSDDELRALWAGLNGRPGRAADALRLRLLLGQRGEEIIGMKWEEINLGARTWDIPGGRTKNRRPHAVPISGSAIAILERRRAEVLDHEGRVFPGLMAWSDDYRALSEITGGAYEWKDLRRTVGTRLAALGFNEETIGRALNHARYTVTARHYIKHAYIAETRAALEAWDRALSDVLAGKEVAKRGKVRAFRR
jgi:integrase